MLTRSRIILIAVAALPLYVVYDYVKLQYWRERLEAMCYEDGGNTIYETVVVPSAVWDRFSVGGDLNVPWDKEENRDAFPYKYRVVTARVKSGNPAIVKSVSTVYRVFDNQVLGMNIDYILGASPLINFLSAYRFSCLEIPGFRVNTIEEALFSKGE